MNAIWALTAPAIRIATAPSASTPAEKLMAPVIVTTPKSVIEPWIIAKAYASPPAGAFGSCAVPSRFGRER